MKTLKAGSACDEITPIDSQFLFGYPHVERYSTGIHDPLYCSALCLESQGTTQMFISNDIIFVGKESVGRIRKKISAETGIPGKNILVSASHTHSGPITVNYLNSENDPVVPKADLEYIRYMEETITRTGIQAASSMVPCEIGLSVAKGKGVGTNRRNPSGPCDPDVPVLAVRGVGDKKLQAVMIVYSMHPTVLHEDSSLVSADFPGMTREFLSRILGPECAILYHTGCEGNQSPRHVTKGNTFEEAKRLGYMLGKAIEAVIPEIIYQPEADLAVFLKEIDLPRRNFPSVKESEIKLKHAVEKLENLRKNGASRQEIRTAECDWFGAEETLTLSKAQEWGRMDAAYAGCLPAEIHLLSVGKWTFVGWPGEIFIEFALKIRREFPDTFIINLANGELQGYIVTKEAEEEGGYEASNGLFGPECGDILIKETVDLILQNSTRKPE